MRVIWSIAAVLLLVVAAGAGEERGAAELELFGGNRGNVPFPHARHQDSLPDCTVCHRLFDQATGSIQTRVAEGGLRRKQVMNTLCVKCHRTARKAGQPSGPTTCSTCHVK